MVSVIIPTLNEEDYLPPLLNSLNKQNGEIEIWIIDGSSDDQTVAVAEQFSVNSNHPVYVRVIERSNVARQRNRGAEYANFPLLLFLDADVILPDGFIEKTTDLINNRNISLAGTKIFAAEHELKFRLMYALYSHIYLPFMRFFNPVLHGCSLFVTKNIHNKIGGFEENITFEDFKYAKTGSTFTRSVLIKEFYVRTSARRFYNPSIRELLELLSSGLLSIFQAGIKGQGFMKGYHKHVGRHANPRYQ